MSELQLSEFKEWFTKKYTYSAEYFALAHFDVGRGFFTTNDMYNPDATNAAWVLRASFDAWNHQQATIDNLKTQLNNMEQCYIQVKKERDDAVYLKEEHRKRRCQLARELTQKSLRLTNAEFEYKRIKELQAKDCLQIMRLTARNEKLSDELKALRGASD